jgi:glycosyltransferase involved in cell wall biosynthesis
MSRLISEDPSRARLSEADPLPPGAPTPVGALRVSIIMPAYNEEASIERVVVEHVDVVRRLDDVVADWEVVCLDDASTDHTAEILERLAAREARLRVIRNSRNCGIFDAFSRLAYAAQGTHIYMTASDGQWPASNLEQLVRSSLSEGVDLVVGVRTSKRQVYSLKRRIVSAGFNLMPPLLFGVRTHDAGSIKFGLRELFTAPMISHGGFIEAERIIRAVRGGYKVAFVPIEFGSRQGGVETGARWANVASALRDCLACSRAYGIEPTWGLTHKNTRGRGRTP